MGITNYVKGQTFHVGGFSGDDPDSLTGAAIKILYEAESDTNAYDDDAVTKLGAIEALATVDQTGAEIKTAYEAESDTNAFSDAEQAKLVAYADAGEVEGLRVPTTNDILVLTDNGKVIEMNSGTAKTIAIPPNTDVAFPVGTIIHFTRYGAGTVEIIEGSGVTIVSDSGNAFIGVQYAGATAYQRVADEWVLFGNLAAS